jgi:glutamate N-acetyltransferase/amino-acid N-acetyltransferase
MRSSHPIFFVLIVFFPPSINLVLFPIPYSLFPIPYSLFPIPYSLFPIPCSPPLSTC